MKKVKEKVKGNLLPFTVWFFPLLTFHFSLFAVSFAASSVEEDIARIQKAYDSIKDIKGSFVQKSHIKDLKRTDVYKGKFFIKKSQKMRWEYKGDKAQEVIINNDDIIIYQKGEKQVFRGKFNRDTYGHAPIALISGFRDIQKEFVVSKKNSTLLLKPIRPMGNILFIKIELSDNEFPINSFTINDTHSNLIKIMLKGVKINTGLKDSIFEISLPEDVNIYDYQP